MRGRVLLAAVSLCLAIAAQGCVRKVEGVWLQPLDAASQRVWFRMRGFSVVVPASWEAHPPGPLMRARVQGRADTGMPITCMWQVVPISKEDGLKPEALLDGELSPESMTGGMEDESISHVQILRTERISVAGHPASHFLFKADWTSRGITVPGEMSTLTVAYSRLVFVSHCGTLAADFPSAEAQIFAVQQSLRRFEELRSADAQTDGRAGGSHKAAEVIIELILIGSVVLGGFAAPRLLVRWPRVALDLVVAIALFEGIIISGFVGRDYFVNEAVVDTLIYPLMLACAPFAAVLGAGLSILLLPRGASRWSGIALMGASLLPIPLSNAMPPVAHTIIYPLIDKIVT